eukprot:scaffold15997_cov157-Skeletonema_dohrnii-CCMP3373.AAC.1
MLLTRMAEEISCRAQSSSNSTAENDDIMMCSADDDVAASCRDLVECFVVCGVFGRRLKF